MDVKEPLDNYELPQANIQKICRQVLPEGTMIQKDAKLALTKACTVFINYITAAYHSLT
jgi:DNA polymerase epsilon subunit 3